MLLRNKRHFNASALVRQAASRSRRGPMSRRDFHLHRPCTCAVDFIRSNQAALTRSEELLAALLPGGVSNNPNQYFFPRRRRLLSIFTDSGKWLDFRAEAQGADLIGFVALRYAARCRGLIASVGPTTRRRRGEGRTLLCGTRSATPPHGDDRSGATISANARQRIREKAGADPAGRSCGRPNRISVQAEGRHQ